MDVKSNFLNEIIEREVYVRQPYGFENPNFKKFLSLCRYASRLDKHIETKYHFIYDYIQKEIFDIKFIGSHHQ
uniref:Retrovirus-related Pol polyprotein from transposon TNT 1-94 n=1 Tax=Cajanus cajan TaxID=3821 RepID=A0A151T8C1_CAJCA|nr:hypothetical protein KK1_017856 [Cajanus cajan]